MNFFKRRNKSVCNMCGKKMDKLEGLKFELQGIYGSKYDGDTIKIRLCAVCLDDMIDNFLIKNSVKKPKIEGAFDWCKTLPAGYRL